MKKILYAVIFSIGTLIAMSAVYLDGQVRDEKYPDIKIVLRQKNNDWLVQEDAALFVARFATVHLIEDWFNKAETRELAKSVAVAVAKHLGSTNDVRIVHFEMPTPASTNIIDIIESRLKGKDVVDEVVPLR